MNSELLCKRLGKILSEIEGLNIEFDQLRKALKVYHAKNAKDMEDKRKRQQASSERMRAELDAKQLIRELKT